MTILSLNVWGLGSTPKIRSIKNIINSHKLKIVLLQDTMNCREKTWGYLSKICPSWHICATNATRLFGGLMTIWNPNIFNFKAYHSSVGILITSIRHRTKMCFRIIYVYFPYEHQKDFWNKADQRRLLNLSSIILVGDLNLIIIPSKHWGHNCRPDPLEDHFQVLFKEKHLTGITPQPIGLTWHNGRSKLMALQNDLIIF